MQMDPCSPTTPVSHISALLFSQSLATPPTPREKLLFLGDTPDSSASVIDIDSPVSSSLSVILEHDDSHSPSTVAMTEAGIDEQGDDENMRTINSVDEQMMSTGSNCDKPAVRVPPVPFLRFELASVGSSSSSGAEDASPPVSVTPASSSVFGSPRVDDENSGDSGIVVDSAASGAVTGSAATTVFFPPDPPSRAPVSTDGFDYAEWSEILEQEKAMDTRPSGCPEFASLSTGTLLWQDGKKPSVANSETPTSSIETPKPKRKDSGRFSVGRQGKMFNDAPSKRGIQNNYENYGTGVGHGDFVNSNGPPENKRRRNSYTALRERNPNLHRSHSVTEAMPALQNDVIDDGRPTALTNWRHANALKCITSETLRKLINGDFSDTVHSYTLIDCRYHYEYDVGHIKGAINVSRPEDLTSLMLAEPVTSAIAMPLDESKRHVYVFYCEFSQKRGPDMARFLRNCDRELNYHRYPELFYPGIYLLDGGYKNFFESCKDLCDPQAYRPMLHKSYANELRICRAKSKSCSNFGVGDSSNASPAKRTGLNLNRRPSNRELFPNRK